MRIVFKRGVRLRAELARFPGDIRAELARVAGAMIAERYQSTAWTVARATAGLLGVFFAWYGVWIGAKLLGGVGIFRNYVILPIPLCALTVSALLLIFLTLGGRPKTRQYLGSALFGGIVVGGTAFFVGFIGPIVVGSVLGQDAPQGPMLGIVITGPLGFVVGSIAGVLVHSFSAEVE